MSNVKLLLKLALFVFQKYSGGGEEKQLSDFRKMFSSASEVYFTFPFKIAFNNMFLLKLKHGSSCKPGSWYLILFENCVIIFITK